MATQFSVHQVLNAIAAASKKLDERKDEVNRLNVFPVPDGDTGTNMSMTIESVVSNIANLAPTASASEIRKAITTGALMGARGNSGVITSQILRGLCEGSVDATEIDADSISAAMDHAVEVAFQAVRKPVEGTILTVLKDSAEAAKKGKEEGLDVDDDLESIVSAAYDSVKRTPELLPVLKENGVVDSGGFGLAILFDSFVASLLGKDETMEDALSAVQISDPKVEIQHFHDWEGSQYRYCNEFLVESDTLDKTDALNFLSTMGDCELCVGEIPKFKVHVHSNHPDQVLKYFLDRGQISEVFIHNMDIQADERIENIKEHEAATHKPIGFVAVAAGAGNGKLLESMGVDVVVSGGQTMNPSTKDLLDAVNRVNADGVIILPDNKNIIMAAQSAMKLAEVPCAVVPTRSIPEAFSALFAVDQEAVAGGEKSLDDTAADMTQACQSVTTVEVTRAIRDSLDVHDKPIKKNDFIGIVNGAIETSGASLDDVVLAVLKTLPVDDMDTMTLLAGEDLSDDDLNQLTETIEKAYPDLEMDAHRGDQPLYPVIFSLE